MSSFSWRGSSFPLFEHPYNATITNERAVEIPIALDFLARGHGRVLEVGNVLSHYFNQEQLPPRVIVDRYEPGYSRSGPETTIKAIDVFEIDEQFDTIVSISTLEHVRWDEAFGESRNEFGPLAALQYVRGLLAPGGTMMATWLWGYNGPLDEWAAGVDGAEALALVRDDHGWYEAWPIEKPDRAVVIAQLTGRAA